MQTGGANYHPLRHMDGQNAYQVGNQKPTSKKHTRTLSNDDRVMEVEGFADAPNMNPGTTFQNKSNSMKNDGDPHIWASHGEHSHQKGTTSAGIVGYDQNGVPVSNYELATSKPLNSSRGIMNRRFQKQQQPGLALTEHQRQISSNSGQANLHQQYGSNSFSENPNGAQLFGRDGPNGSNQNKGKGLKGGS